MSTVKSKKLQVGTDATSSNNFTIYQPATPDGTLRIGVGNADSPTEVGQFNANGYKPATAPAFSAYPTAQQTLSSAVSTVVVLDAEEFDTTSRFNNTGSTVNGIPAYSFMPNVAGYYMFSTTVSNEVSVSSARFIVITQKNGTGGDRVFDYQNTGTFNAPGTILYYLNGTTDYVTLRVYVVATTAKLNHLFSQTRFQGFLIQQA
jgi:hypothetical protein